MLTCWPCFPIYTGSGRWPPAAHPYQLCTTAGLMSVCTAAFGASNRLSSGPRVISKNFISFFLFSTSRHLWEWTIEIHRAVDSHPSFFCFVFFFSSGNSPPLAGIFRAIQKTKKNFHPKKNYSLAIYVFLLFSPSHLRFVCPPHNKCRVCTPIWSDPTIDKEYLFFFQNKWIIIAIKSRYNGKIGLQLKETVSVYLILLLLLLLFHFFL